MLALLTLSPAYVVPHAALRPASACLRPQSDMSVPLERRAVAPLDPRRRAVPPQLTSLQTAEEVEVPAELESNEPMPMEKVLPRGCPSCEDSWLKTSRETEAEETARLAEVAKTNLSEVLEVSLGGAGRMASHVLLLSTVAQHLSSHYSCVARPSSGPSHPAPHHPCHTPRAPPPCPIPPSG